MSDNLVVSMYFDKATANKYFNRNCVGILNDDFAEYVVPFVCQSEGEQSALRKYARAHRAAKGGLGPPYILLTVKIAAKYALDHFLKQEIKVMDHLGGETVGFTMPVNITNYPHMQPVITKFDDPDVPDNLLRSGYELLERW